MMLMNMEFPLDREIMTTVRLATGGICSLAGFGLDASEDCKVCITESLLLLLHAGCKRAKLGFFREEGLRIELLGEGGVPSEEKTKEEEISVALLTALVDGLSIESTAGGTRISFAFKDAE